MNNLSFKKLREASLNRTNKIFHKLEDWSWTDWACALAGEVGEACNIVKKIRRGDKTFFEKGKERPLDKKALADELADVVIYADLLAAAAGIDLGQAIQDKFNEVSDKCKCEIKL